MKINKIQLAVRKKTSQYSRRRTALRQRTLSASARTTSVRHDCSFSVSVPHESGALHCFLLLQSWLTVKTTLTGIEAEGSEA